MTMRTLSRDEVRAVDARAATEFHLPTIVLMENAGRGAAERLRTRLQPGDRVLVACGAGNNGGDGLVVARHLDAWNFPVHIAWFADPGKLKGDALIQKQIVDAAEISQSVHIGVDDLSSLWNGVAWIVDGLLGTGLTRPVEGMFQQAIEAINASGLPVMALDLPSGLDADTGEPLGTAIRARFTTTFVAAKRGFARPGARAYTGEVEVVEIGIPGKLLRGLPFDAESSKIGRDT